MHPEPAEGVYSVARPTEQYGAEVDLDVLERSLTAACKWQRPPGAVPPRKYGARCLAGLPDLGGMGPDRPSRRVLRVVK